MVTKIVDRNGLELQYFNHLWWSNNFDRFWQLLSSDVPVLIHSGKNNVRFLYRNSEKFTRSRWQMHDVFQRYNYLFIDPESQQIFPEAE